MSQSDDEKELFFTIARNRQLERDLSEWVNADLAGRAELAFDRAKLGDPSLMLADKRRIDAFRITLIQLAIAAVELAVAILLVIRFR